MFIVLDTYNDHKIIELTTAMMMICIVLDIRNAIMTISIHTIGSSKEGGVQTPLLQQF